MSAPRSCGISFAGLLTVVFIAFKLGGIISWSWWWVLAPLWIGYAIALLIVAVALLAAALS